MPVTLTGTEVSTAADPLNENLTARLVGRSVGRSGRTCPACRRYWVPASPVTLPSHAAVHRFHDGFGTGGNIHAYIGK